MRLLKFVRNQIILTAFVCTAGYVAYQVLLDDNAKHQVDELVGTVKESANTLTGIVNDRIGMVMDEDLVWQNRERIRKEWGDLGF